MPATPTSSESPRPAWPEALIWTGVTACVAGLVWHRLWQTLPPARFGESLLLAALAVLLAWPLRRWRGIAWADALALVWIAALLALTGPVPALSVATTLLAAAGLGGLLVGSARPLLQALQHAVAEMQRWLVADYGFSERGASAFKPVEGEQYEAGVKYQPNDSSLLTLSVYQIKQKNVLTGDIEYPEYQLQEGEVRPVGATETRPVDVRILSATHRNLEEAIASGEFREDLYYRLNVVALTLPPLRERREDIPLLARHFLTVLTEKYRRRIHGFAPDALDMLTAADWPGNIRQLHNVLEQCVALCTTSTIPASLVARALRDKPADIQPLAEARSTFERDYLISLLKLTRGQVSEVARLAGRNRTEVYRLLQRHGLTPALFKDRDDA